MKNKISFLVLILGLFLTINMNAQPHWGTNTPLNLTSSALGDGNNVTGNFSTTLGINNEINGFNSFAFGTLNKANGPHSFALGERNEANNVFSYAFGRRMVNNTPNSFLIGFMKPVFMATSNNAGTGVRVGIATDNPQSRLDIRLGDRQEIRIQAEVPNTYGGISFKHSDGSENWRIRAYSNFHGGYDNILGINSKGGEGRLWVNAKTTMIGDWFDFDPCTDCDEYKLFVKKGIRTEKIKVDVASGTWADYVFKSEYDLNSLEYVEKFIARNGHLPNMPSALQVEKEGLDLGNISKIQQEKIEELTLYTIQLQKELNELKQLVRDSINQH